LVLTKLSTAGEVNTVAREYAHNALTSVIKDSEDKDPKLRYQIEAKTYRILAQQK
jgi:hypothetical protein